MATYNNQDLWSRQDDIQTIGSLLRQRFGDSVPLLTRESNEESPLITPLLPEVVNLASSSGPGFTTTGSPPSEIYLDNDDEPVDLKKLWELLERMDKTSRQNGSHQGIGINGIDGNSGGSAEGDGKMSTWELVALQGVLLTVLILVSILWAFCCKRRCLADRPLMTEMVALARKISNGSSRDLPPSYSKVDLTSVGLTLDDHFNPPPDYDRAANLRELHDHHRRPSSRYSLSSTGSFVNATNQDTVLTLEDIRAETGHRSRTISAVSSMSIPSVNDIRLQHESSAGHTPRRCSRVRFSPCLEEGPTSRKESSQSLPPKSVLVKHETRKRSALSEGGTSDSRKVSFLDEKPGQSKSLCPNPILEDELNEKLEAAIERGEIAEFVPSASHLNCPDGKPTSPPMI